MLDTVRCGLLMACLVGGCFSKPPAPGAGDGGGGNPAATCPALGETPRFTTFPQIVASGVFPVNYTFDEARTLAVAYIPSMGIVEGTVDSDQLMLSVLERDPGDNIDQPALSPEGDELFVRRRVGVTTDYAILRYTRDGSQWKRAEIVPIPIGGQDQLGVPTRREPTRRMVIHRGGAIEEFREYEEGVGSWQLVGTYTRPMLQVMLFANPNITPDGLRLVFSATTDVVTRYKALIADRPDVTSAFGPARLMVELPGDITDPFMTNDCWRLYFNASPGLNFIER